MPNSDGNESNRNSKNKGIHHLNIRDKKRIASRLRNAFKKVEVPLEIKSSGEKLTAIVVLMEVLPNSCYLFLQKKLHINSAVNLHLLEPLAIEVPGRIRYCEQINVGSPLQVEKNSQMYRTLIEFQLSSNLERKALHDFYQQVRDESYVATQWHMYVSEKMEKAQRAKSLSKKLSEQIDSTVKGENKDAINEVANQPTAAETTENEKERELAKEATAEAISDDSSVEPESSEPEDAA